MSGVPLILAIAAGLIVASSLFRAVRARGRRMEGVGSLAQSRHG